MWIKEIYKSELTELKARDASCPQGKKMEVEKTWSCRGKSMEKFSVLLMIAAIVCALFADKIDTAVKGDKKVKKVIVVFSVGVLLGCTIAIVASILA